MAVDVVIDVAVDDEVIGGSLNETLSKGEPPTFPNASSMPSTLAWTIPHATHIAELATRHTRISCINDFISRSISCSRRLSSSAYERGGERLSSMNVEIEDEAPGVETMLGFVDAAE